MGWEYELSTVIRFIIIMINISFYQQQLFSLSPVSSCISLFSDCRLVGRVRKSSLGWKNFMPDRLISWCRLPQWFISREYT